MAALRVTYSDNMSGMKIGMLHDLIWRASLRDIDRAFVWRCVFISGSPGHSYSQIPTELRLCFVSADDLFIFFIFFPEQSHLISASGGTMSGRHVHSHYPEPFINVL